MRKNKTSFCIGRFLGRLRKSKRQHGAPQMELEGRSISCIVVRLRFNCLSSRR